MRHIPATWRSVLANPQSRIVILVTISREWLTMCGCDHPASQSGVLRYATSTAVVTDGLARIPFFGRLAEWPTLRMAISRQERRAELTSAEIALAPGANFPGAAARARGLYGRVDFWADGIPISDVIPYAAGRLIDIDAESDDGSVRFSIIDQPPTGDPQLSPGFIEADEFPDAPATVRGASRRRIIIGSFPYPLVCPQIDTDGKRFYLGEPAVSHPPTEVTIDGESASNDNPPQIVTKHFQNTIGHTYSEIVFPRRVKTTEGFGVVLAAGGAGVEATSALDILIRQIANVEIADSAKALVARIDREIALSLLIDAEAGAMELVTERILPQTNMVSFYTMGKLDGVDLVEPGSDRELSIGTGLLYRLTGQTDKLTSELDVYNLIEIIYRSSSGRVQRTEAKYILDASYGGTLARLLAASQKAYGPRATQVPAEDLPAADTVGAGRTPQAIRDLAAGILQVTAFQHRSETYQMTWASGLALTRNSRRLITDPDIGWSREPCRVVEIEYPAYGPQVTFQTEDITT